MKQYTIEQYLDAGCEELKLPVMMAVHMLTRGKVCDTGCHAFNGGACKAYKNLVKGQTAISQPTETVREEAARRGVTIAEVRRDRRKNEKPQSVS